LTHAVFIALSCSCYLWKWCHVARVAIPQGENSNFAKQNPIPISEQHPNLQRRSLITIRASPVPATTSLVANLPVQ